MNIQKTLDLFKPYLLSIRILENMYFVDLLLKDDWVMLESPTIESMRGEDKSLNYRMLYSQNNEITLDDLLLFAKSIIDFNIDKEAKHELLKAKVQELKESFKNKSLDELKKLKFVVDEDNFIPPLNEFDVNVESNFLPIQENIELSEEEREIIEEEKRAEKFRELQNKNKISKTIKTNKINIELPIKQVVVKTDIENNNSKICECGDDEACDKCIDTKY